MRDRVLLRASRSGHAYRELLELRKGAIRLLVPSPAARRRGWLISVLLVFGAAAAVTMILQAIRGAWAPALSQDGPFLLALGLGYGLGIVAVVFEWDRYSLSLLADDVSESFDVEVLETESFGTFQEVRGVAAGDLVRVAVSASRRRMEDALRLAGIRAAVA